MEKRDVYIGRIRFARADSGIQECMCNNENGLQRTQVGAGELKKENEEDKCMEEFLSVWLCLTPAETF